MTISFRIIYDFCRKLTDNYFVDVLNINDLRYIINSERAHVNVQKIRRSCTFMKTMMNFNFNAKINRADMEKLLTIAYINRVSYATSVCHEYDTLKA